MDEITYTLFWLTGETELVSGKTIADAMNNAGYGFGAVRALDFCKKGDARDEYSWVDGRWRNNEYLKLEDNEK